ncbi:sirohydrochlorin cobaltochelatase [Dialister sp.]|jgi:sirohydrochlorin cobaltochelatase|uniref:sirohydrochlorin cobaltochelatase n=1 Tax=Dialister sp. TaxID=1955814 RepID=UPI003A5C1C01
MKKSFKKVVIASMAALSMLGMGMSVNAYELNPEVKDVTPALREASTVGVWSHENPAMKNAPNKDAILVMTFGTTFTDTRHKTIDAVEKAIQAANPNVPVYEAYTSHIIIDRVKAKEGITKLTPEEAFAKLKAEGYTRVAVVSLDVIPGMEYTYDSVVTKMQVNNFKKISLATPLMYFQGTEGEPDQVVDFLQNLKSQFPKCGPQDAIMIMAHGTPHPGNAYYSVIQARINQLAKTDPIFSHVYVYSVEGRPNINDVIPQLKEKGYKHVTLMPIMMVAGDHANNDMAGSDPDSHKSQLEAQGFTVSTYIHGLGENANIRKLYVERANEALADLQK